MPYFQNSSQSDPVQNPLMLLIPKVKAQVLTLAQKAQHNLAPIFFVTSALLQPH